MAGKIIMERGQERSFIPKELVQDYLLEGWKEVEAANEAIPQVAEVQQPETLQPAAVVKPRAGGRGRGKSAAG